MFCLHLNISEHLTFSDFIRALDMFEMRTEDGAFKPPPLRYLEGDGICACSGDL